MNVHSVIDWLSGKKTYLVAFAAAIYACGIEQSWWQHQVWLDVLFGAMGVGTMRAAIAKIGGDSVPENKPAGSTGVPMPPEKGQP